MSRPNTLVEYHTSEGDTDLTYVIVNPEYTRDDPDTGLGGYIEWDTVYVKGDPAQTDLMPVYPTHGDPLWPLYERIYQHLAEHFFEAHSRNDREYDD